MGFHFAFSICSKREELKGRINGSGGRLTGILCIFSIKDGIRGLGFREELKERAG